MGNKRNGEGRRGGGRVYSTVRSFVRSFAHTSSTYTHAHAHAQISLVEWFADNYTKFGTTLEFVTNRSQEGNQFCKGFGGVGGLLRWKVGAGDGDYGLVGCGVVET